LELSGYTDDEKLKIALSHLLPRQLKRKRPEARAIENQQGNHSENHQ